MSDIYNFNHYKVDEVTRKIINRTDLESTQAVRRYLTDYQKVPDVVAEIILSFWMDLYLLRMYYRLTIEIKEKYNQRIEEIKELDSISRISLALEVFPLIKRKLEKKKDYFLMFLSILGDSDLKHYVRKSNKNYERVGKTIHKWRTEWNTDYCAQYQLREYIYGHINDFMRHLKKMSHRVLTEPATLKRVTNKCCNMLVDLKNFNYVVHLVMEANVKIQDPDNVASRFWNWTNLSNPYRLKSWSNYYGRHTAPEITTAWWMSERTRDKNVDMCHDICGKWRDFDAEYGVEEDTLKAKKEKRKAQKAIEAIKRINETARDWISIEEVRDGQVIAYDQPVGFSDYDPFEWNYSD